MGKTFNTYNERVKKANKMLQDKMNKVTKEAFDAEQKAAGEKVIAATENKPGSSTEVQESYVQEETLPSNENDEKAAKAQDKNNKLIAAAKVAARAERIVSAGCTNALIGCPKDKNDYEAYKSSFFGKNYALLKQILTEYKASGTVAKKEESTTANTTNAPAEASAATGTGAETPAAETSGN